MSRLQENDSKFITEMMDESGLIYHPNSMNIKRDDLKEELLKDEFSNKLNLIQKIADDLKVSMAQLSIAWCLKNKNVSTVILGASKKSQLKENLAALEVCDKLDSQIMELLNKP